MRQGITDEQSRLLASWLGSYTVVRDYSWPLQDNGQIKVIDFGRAERRPWMHDLVRLSHQQFVHRPELADAFYAGLGRTVRPAEADLWRLENMNQAVGTVVWADQMGDTAFEQSGRDMGGCWPPAERPASHRRTGLFPANVLPGDVTKTA